MVASDDRFPHQIFTKGKMNNAIAAHICNYQLNVTFRRQEGLLVTFEISTFNNYRIVLCSTC